MPCLALVLESGVTNMTLKRTISGMIGTGSLAHNRREFIAENVDSDRVQLNICYQNENLKEVYKELFDEAVERYNIGKRKDRQITNYYEKIRQGKQEKLFHEVIFQIGNREDMAVGTAEGDLAVKILDEYVKDFQKRNPTLRVFGCYLHQDEATPHLHIDFIPYVKDKEELGVVLSDSGFSGYLKIKDIIPILQNMYSKFDKSLFIEQVQKFQLPMNKQIKEFSTGMKAKLKVLVAISHNAKLLILDEPTAGLDVIARDELLEMLREFLEKDEERSILISSHISSDLESLCDDLYMIHDGKIILHEDTDVLLSDYALLKVDAEQYSKLDKQFILRSKKETYGYSCLTNQKQYYMENYPKIAIEKGTIDEVITMMIRGTEQ